MLEEHARQDGTGGVNGSSHGGLGDGRDQLIPVGVHCPGEVDLAEVGELVHRQFPQAEARSGSHDLHFSVAGGNGDRSDRHLLDGLRGQARRDHDGALLQDLHFRGGSDGQLQVGSGDPEVVALYFAQDALQDGLGRTHPDSSIGSREHVGQVVSFSSNPQVVPSLLFLCFYI